MKSLVSIFALICFVTGNITLAHAQETEEPGDYIEIEEGQEAPYSGYLFDRDGIATLIAKNEKDKELIIVEKDTEYKKLKINLEAEILKKQTELELNKKLSEDLLKLNKEEIKTTKSKLDQLTWTNPALFIVGITLGAVFTISILKISVDAIK
jgi:hypothetical protein